jgi:hypothetical protein
MSFVPLLWQLRLAGIDVNFMGRCYLITICTTCAHMVIPYVILVNLCRNLALYKWMKPASCAIGEVKRPVRAINPANMLSLLRTRSGVLLALHAHGL